MARGWWLETPVPRFQFHKESAPNRDHPGDNLSLRLLTEAIVLGFVDLAGDFVLLPVHLGLFGLCQVSTGGENSNFISPFLTDAEPYNPSIPTFTHTGSLNNGRCVHTATLLNNGQVLIAAGTGARQSAELYDPTSGTFRIQRA